MKPALTLFALILSSFIAFGQRSGILFMPKIGAAFNSVYDHPTGDNPWTFKFSPLLIGLEASKEISGRTAGSADLYFLRRGTHSKLQNGRRLDDYNFDYLVLGAQLKYMLFPQLRLEAFAGPYAGYCIRAEHRYSSDEEFANYKHDDFKDFDFGAHIGLGKYFNIAGLDFLVQPRFQLGLTRFSYTKQISFQLMLGVRV